MPTRLRLARPTIRTVDARTVRPPPKEADAELQTSAWRALSRECKRRAGWQCEARLADGSRCQVRHPAALYADHIVERKDGGAALPPVEQLQCLCASHNVRKGLQARLARAQARP